MNNLQLLYKRETGEYPFVYTDERDLYFYRSKGKWVLDESTSDRISIIRHNSGVFHIEDDQVYNKEYVEWLELKLETLLKI